ncbi:MAG: hypothetical protein GC171_16795 [Terrimonas sp.]|nr:hypothetical protein [Terrimonas sp.]
MKSFYPLIGLSLAGLLACRQPNNNQQLQNKIDSLEQLVANPYKPGLGEFMSGIQVHHAKLWFAGENQNWALADFEINEIREALEDIRAYCSDRPETKEISMADQPLDSLSKAISDKDLKRFTSSFKFLTLTCNRCHTATQHAFNIITLPTTPPFSNQSFNISGDGSNH